MSAEAQVLNEIHFRDTLQELKEIIKEEVSKTLEEKLTAWQSSLGGASLAASNDETTLPHCQDNKHESSQNNLQTEEKVESTSPSSHGRRRTMSSFGNSGNVLSATDSWSPDWSRAMHQVDRANTITKALTRSHSKIGRSPGGRVYVSRPSLLTELLQVSHIGSLYNIFVAILLLLLIQKLTEDAFTYGSVNLEMSMVQWCFGGMEHVIVIWLSMFAACSVLVYTGLHVWAHYRHIRPRAMDSLCGCLFAVYLCLLLYLPATSLLHHRLPLASSFIILCEQVRFFMKSWAFVRSNLSRAFTNSPNLENYKKNDGDANVSESEVTSTSRQDSSKPVCPDFSKYLYFLFAPTLVYRDQYPRNARIQWGKVVTDLCQVVGCIFYTHFLFVRFCVPVFQQFGNTEQPLSAMGLVMSVFTFCFPASLVLLCAFFALLHAWMNAFAEIMRFADRMFYKDWWNSTSYSRFYRTWNCVVHDWLFEYVYMELHDCKSSSRVQLMPLLVVFLISAVVHEYILALAFRFFYPVLLFMFGGFGVVLMFIKTRARQFNVFLWVSLILGTGILMCLYSLEWYARKNCAPNYEGFMDHLVPRSWFCISLTPQQS